MATATTTYDAPEGVCEPQEANVVLNVFYNQSVSPYLNEEKDENRCEEILESCAATYRARTRLEPL